MNYCVPVRSSTSVVRRQRQWTGTIGTCKMHPVPGWRCLADELYTSLSSKIYKGQPAALKRHPAALTFQNEIKLSVELSVSALPRTVLAWSRLGVCSSIQYYIWLAGARRAGHGVRQPRGVLDCRHCDGSHQLTRGGSDCWVACALELGDLGPCRSREAPLTSRRALRRGSRPGRLRCR